MYNYPPSHVCNPQFKYDTGDQTDIRRRFAAVRHSQEPQMSTVVVTRDATGAIVAVTRQDAEGRVLEVIAEAQPATDAQQVAWVAAHTSGKALHFAIKDGWRVDCVLTSPDKAYETVPAQPAADAKEKP